AGQQQYPEGLVQVGIVLQPDVGPCNRFDTFAARRLVELDETKQISQIGQGHGRLLVLHGALDKLWDTGDAVHYRKLGVDAQMDKSGCGGRIGHAGIVSQSRHDNPEAYMKYFYRNTLCPNSRPRIS